MSSFGPCVPKHACLERPCDQASAVNEENAVTIEQTRTSDRLHLHLVVCLMFRAPTDETKRRLHRVRIDREAEFAHRPRSRKSEGYCIAICRLGIGHVALTVNRKCLSLLHQHILKLVGPRMFVSMKLNRSKHLLISSRSKIGSDLNFTIMVRGCCLVTMPLNISL